MNVLDVPKTKELKLFNTLTRQKETLTPLEKGVVKMYTCGPTVYNFVHIGNLRTFVFEDLLRRTMKLFGYSLSHVMNLTDVDDKTIRGAIAKNVTLDEFTEPYKKAFFEDIASLNIEKAEHYPCATEYIQDMIEMISTLIEKGVAYKGADGSIYYAIKKFPHYGCLSHFHVDDLQVGASQRVASDEYEKDNAVDFVLWKHYDPQRDGNIYWESPFGKGRPGWHLECSTMAMKILGETIDIHVGGVDNMFPHHENEIAQSEACSGKQFSKMWMHAEHLIVDSKKMSKSLGNFFTLRDLFKMGFSGIEVRYMLLQTHYKTQLNFTMQGLEAARASLQRVSDFIRRIRECVRKESGADKIEEEIIASLQNAQDHFYAALGDDLNISSALAALYEMIRELNNACDRQKMTSKGAEETLKLLKDFNRVLGVLNFEPVKEEIPQQIQQLLEQRIEARKNKQWAESDRLRDEILSHGYIIEDTPSGVRLKRG